MNSFTSKITKAQEKGKIEYYDYIKYKKAIGWKNKSGNNWIRPKEIKKAKYNAYFQNNVPEYFFLGINIKDLLRFINSSKDSHLGSIALSLFYNEFKIITCYLKSYIKHCYENNKNINGLNHSFLLINNKQVIDPFFGIITNLNTYNKIFNCCNINTISSKNLKETSVYKYINKLKNESGPNINDYKMCTNNFKEYQKQISKYALMCHNFTNKDKEIELFINGYLPNEKEILEIKSKIFYEYICQKKIPYPNYDMISINDDLKDFTLNGTAEEIIINNLEALQKQEEISKIKKQKVKIKSLKMRNNI